MPTTTPVPAPAPAPMFSAPTNAPKAPQSRTAPPMFSPAREVLVTSRSESYPGMTERLPPTRRYRWAAGRGSARRPPRSAAVNVGCGARPLARGSTAHRAGLTQDEAGRETLGDSGGGTSDSRPTSDRFRAPTPYRPRGANRDTRFGRAVYRATPPRPCSRAGAPSARA